MANFKMKPLGGKAYGSIAHLPISKMGQGDKRIHRGQAKICLEKTRDKHDEIIVQEKVDGSCVAVARIDDELIPLVRRGYTALSSPHEQHHIFHNWVFENSDRFMNCLENGQRIVGEWMLKPHGIIYDLPHENFIAFDIMIGKTRFPFDLFRQKANEFVQPKLIHRGEPYPLYKIYYDLYESGHGAEVAEGAVYRVQRKGEIDFLAKFVRPDFVPGKYFDTH